MNIKIGDFNIKVGKSHAAKNLELSDFDVINDMYLKYMNDMDNAEISSRVSRVSIDDLIGEQNCNKAEKLLAESGIFVVPNFLNNDISTTISQKLSSTLSYIKELQNTQSGFYEDENLAIQGETVRFKKYLELAEYKKPIVTIRQGQDNGMLDIFNFDKLREISMLNIRGFIESTNLGKIISNAGEKNLSLANINLYRNSGIRKTRGFHIDGFDNTLKAFIYLTDVENLSDGPYCFCRKSHLPGPFRNLNSALSSKGPNPTESIILDTDTIIPVLGKAGTLVVSNQTGIHRGHPQSASAERNMLVMRYR